MTEMNKENLVKHLESIMNQLDSVTLDNVSMVTENCQGHLYEIIKKLKEDE